MALFKVVEKPSDSKVSKVRKSLLQKPEKRNKKSKCDFTGCLKKTIRVILLGFLIGHVIWGFVEAPTAMITNFIINHPHGVDGFTLFRQFHLVDITEYEHQAWELPENVKVHLKSDKEKAILYRRNRIITKCSKSSKHQNITNHTNCNNANKEFRDKNYFCAIIEHPDKFHKVFKPLISLWVASACLYLSSAPLIMFAFVWHSQCIRLLIIHMVFQLIPMGMSCSIVIDLWIEYRFELCALDYMYKGLRIRSLLSISVAVKIVSKLAEIFFTTWFIYAVRVEREQRGFGVRQLKSSKRVGTEGAVTLHNEVLQPGRNRDEEEEDEEEEEENIRAGRVGRYRVSINPTVKAKEKQVVQYDKDYKTPKKVIRSQMEIPADQPLPD